MSNSRQFQRQKTTPILSTLSNAWKVRPINGFEKHLFPNSQTISKHKPKTNIDPARFIYPRDAMGNMLIPLNNRSTRHGIPFYLPKYDVVKSRSPAWSIKNIHDTNAIPHHISPAVYDTAKSKASGQADRCR